MLVDVKLVDDPITSMIASVNGNSTKTERLETGVYEIGHFSLDHAIPYELTFQQQYPEQLVNHKGEWFGSYGVCDNYEQILTQCPMLKDDDTRKFVVSVTPVLKENQESSGGWRWHKWGDYIGDHEPQCEYLYDEPDIDKVYVYHICELP